MYSILAPPITDYLESIVLPSMSSIKNLAYLLTRDKMRIPWAFLSLIVSYGPYSMILCFLDSKR